MTCEWELEIFVWLWCFVMTQLTINYVNKVSGFKYEAWRNMSANSAAHQRLKDSIIKCHDTDLEHCILKPFLDILSTWEKSLFINSGYIHVALYVLTYYAFLCLKQIPKIRRYIYHQMLGHKHMTCNCLFELWYRNNYLRNSVFSVIKSKLERASGCLSSDFGVIRIRGLRNGRAIWRRKMWK
jgi:hypothetical protein